MHYEAQKKREEERLRSSSPKKHYPPETEIIASLSNHELTGVQNWGDLGDIDCEERYKNEFEAAVGFPINKNSVIEFYEN